MAGRCIQDAVDGTSVQYALVRDNICGRGTMDAKDATQTRMLDPAHSDRVGLKTSAAENILESL